MAVIRRTYRTFLLIGWLLIIWPCLFFARFGERWKSQQRLGKVSKIWGKGIAWIFGIEIKIIGYTENIEGGLIISNHTGYVDILVHAGIWPTRFAAKDSIRTWPLIGWFVGTGRPIWIDRKSRQKSKIAAKAFKDTINNDVLMLVYPEGTSTSGKDGILQLKSTSFEAVIEGNNWIIPSVIRYADTPDGKAIAWYDDMSFVPHIWRIFGYKRIYAEVTVLEPFKPDGRNRKELAQYTHDKMEEEYNKFFRVEK
jgi:1-acyl-sn-glycerol-3-phosphate acyltransferase